MHFKDIKIGMPVTFYNIVSGIVSNICTDDTTKPIIEIITSDGLRMWFLDIDLSRHRRR